MQASFTSGTLVRRLGEVRDRSFEQQRHRASGLNSLTAAILLWKTVYLERAGRALRRDDQKLDEARCQHLSPLAGRTST